MSVLGKWTGVIGIGSLATYYRRYTIEDLVLYIQANRVALRMRRDLYDELLTKNIQFHSKYTPGELTHILGTDIWQIANSLTFEASSAMRGGAFFFGGVGYLVYASPHLTAVSLVPMLVMAGLSRHYGTKLRVERLEVAEQFRKIAQHTQERLSQIKTVKLYTGEAREKEVFKNKQNIYYAQTQTVARLTATHMAIIEVLGQNSIIWILGYGAILISQGAALSVGSLTAFAVYSIYAGMGFRLLASGYTEIKKISGIYEKIKTIHEGSLDKEQVLLHYQPFNKLGQGANILFKDVSFRYKDRESTVVEKLNFEIKAGEVVGIIGHSGSGKSTIFHLLTNLYRPDSGEIIVNGENILEKPSWWIRQHIGIVSQENVLFSTSIKDNILYSKPEATQAEIKEAAQRADADYYIENFPDKYDTEVGEQGMNLSGGQRQRIAIARAMLKMPEIFLMDEATSGLDAASEFNIQRILEREITHRGPTVLIITHKLPTLKNITDKIILLKNGRIYRVGTYQELEEDEVFRDLLMK